MKKKEKANIEEKVIAVLREEKRERSLTHIRVVQWIIDGKASKPKLEKRNFNIFNDKRVTGKATGFTSGDLEFINSNIEEIFMLMEG